MDSNAHTDTNKNIEVIDSVIPGSTIESNIPSLAQQLFSMPPGKPFSIGLQLETGDVESRSPEQAQTIFEVLAHLLLYGIKVKYGEQQDPRRLNETQIETITEYMRSFGFNVILTSYPIEQTMDDPEEYTPNDIEFYRLRMIDPDMGVWHDIKIEHYQPDQPIAHQGRLL